MIVEDLYLSISYLYISVWHHDTGHPLWEVQKRLSSPIVHQTCGAGTGPGDVGSALGGIAPRFDGRIWQVDGWCLTNARMPQVKKDCEVLQKQQYGVPSCAIFRIFLRSFWSHMISSCIYAMKLAVSQSADPDHSVNEWCPQFTSPTIQHNPTATCENDRKCTIPSDKQA